MIYYDGKKFKKFISNQEIKEKILEISLSINKYYKNEEVIILCVLDGGVPTFSELVKNLKIDYSPDYIKLSSYKGTTKSSGKIDIDKNISLNIKDKKILIIEDIVDTGRTLDFLYKKLLDSGAKEVKTFSLLFKRNNYKFRIGIDWYGFEIEDLFSIGYGMDYKYKFRGLNDIYVLS